ncbi:MAG: sigma-70 family RNA polymerase sigma factor [Ruminococcaceae bacterium]|nr:sigma-70 family RNA polymerase sigma factor [Oscillospiraceae bacterium]
MVIDEKKCIKKAAKGDASAFEELLLRYHGQIYNLCLRMTGNPDDAADLTQEAFLKVWKNLESFQFDSAFSTWLYRLASNCCLDFLRSQKRRPTVSLTVENEEDEQVMDIPDAQPTPEEQAVKQEEKEQLHLAMQMLDEEQRQILTLRVVNDLSYTEIADILRVKEGTVKSRLSRARENLRKKLLEIGNKGAFSASYHQEGRDTKHEL